jgi:hypothetical protein
MIDSTISGSFTKERNLAVKTHSESKIISAIKTEYM